MALRIALGVVGVLVTVLACGKGAPATPLAAAAREGSLADIDRLIASGANPNEPSGRADWPPLVHAIHKRQHAAVERLLERGASVAGDAGRTALFMASGYGDARTVKLLMARGVAMPRTAEEAGRLIAAAVGGAWDIDSDWAGCALHTEVVRLLVERDPDFRVVRVLSPRSFARARATVENRIASAYARSRGCEEMLRLLEVRRG